MACNLTKGRLVDCKDVIGGLKAVYFTKSYCSNIRAKATFDGTNENEMDTAGFANWDIFSTGAVDVFQYDLRQNLSSYTININSDPATGTTFFEQTLNIVLQKNDLVTSRELKLLAYNRAQIFVLDNNDNVLLLGMDNGCDLTTGTQASGAAKGDMAGYNLTFTAQEKEACIWLAATGGVTQPKYPFDGLTDEADLAINVGT